MIRKIIKKCVDEGLFEETPEIHRQPLLSLVPTDIIGHCLPPTKKKGRQTIRYAPAQKVQETPEMLQLAGELYNHKILDQLQRHFKAGKIKEFYATAEKVLRVESGNPVVRSVIVGDQLISERDQVDQAIADYFQEVYGGDGHQADAEANMALWTRLEAVAEMALGMFTV